MYFFKFYLNTPLLVNYSLTTIKMSMDKKEAMVPKIL